MTIAAATLRLIRLVRQWRPDVLHAHMMTSALLAWPACRIYGVPFVTTVHNEFEKSSIVMGIGSRVIAVSGAVGRSMVQRGVPGRRLRVVLNGTIGAARLANADRTPQRLGSPSIIFVGGLHPRKGVTDLLHAFDAVHRENPATRLYIVGEGPHSDEYRAIAGAMDCAAAVTFTGAQSNPRSYLLGADIFVLPSHADPAPLVVSEAREAGCAIVATEVDGIPEMLEHGEAGILVPSGDRERLAEAIGSLANDADLLQVWRQRSQINIEHLSVERMARDTLAVYAECVAQSGRGRRRDREPADAVGAARTRGDTALSRRPPRATTGADKSGSMRQNDRPIFSGKNRP